MHLHEVTHLEDHRVKLHTSIPHLNDMIDGRAICFWLTIARNGRLVTLEQLGRLKYMATT